MVKNAEKSFKKELERNEKVPETVLEQYNPLITNDHLRIIEASIPKHTVKQLLGLDNNQFLVYKMTEDWIKKRKNI